MLFRLIKAWMDPETAEKIQVGTVTLALAVCHGKYLCLPFGARAQDATLRYCPPPSHCNLPISTHPPTSNLPSILPTLPLQM